MIFDCRDKSRPPPKGRCFDAATGEHVPKVFYYDTETHKVGRYVDADEETYRAHGIRFWEHWERRVLRVVWTG